VTDKDIAQWENGIRTQVATLAKNTIRPVPPFHFSTAELCALLGLNGPSDVLHANRLRYVKRAISTAPAALWSLLYANGNEHSWMPLLMSSYKWLRTHLPRVVLPEFQDAAELIAFIAIDEKWKGRVRVALKSCQRFTAAHAKGKLWTCKVQTQISKFGSLPDLLHSASGRKWRCNLCDAGFDSKKALAVHARHKHQYRTMLKYFVLGMNALHVERSFSTVLERLHMWEHLQLARTLILLVLFQQQRSRLNDLKKMKEIMLGLYEHRVGHLSRPSSQQFAFAVLFCPEVALRMQPL
jgi:hypothetical protein